MYSFTSHIRFSEVDLHRKLSLSSIVNYFQDCSTFQSEALGLGFDYLAKQNRVWLMSAWQIQILRLPSFGEHIRICTWPYDFKSMYGYRNFTIEDADTNETFVAANSIWVLADTITGKPAKVSPEHVSAYGMEPPYPMEYANRKIILPEELHPLPSFPVVQSQLDYNQHVNNGQYIRMAEAYLPENFITAELRADYRKSALANDIIYPYRSVAGDTCTIVLGDADQKPYTTVQFICKH